MTNQILDLSAAPSDAIERLAWLSGVNKQVERELDAAYQQAYYKARLTQRMAGALSLGIHPKKRVLKWTQRENNKLGRRIRWNDGYGSAANPRTPD